MNDEELMALAKRASENAYVPYSGFHVGAALECEGGSLYTGCNVENAAYGSTICAERTAAVKAVSAGERVFTRIAIWGNSQHDYCWPCGACRQFLAEFCPDGSMKVLVGRGDGSITSMTLSQLLPGVFIF